MNIVIKLPDKAIMQPVSTQQLTKNKYLLERVKLFTARNFTVYKSAGSHKAEIIVRNIRPIGSAAKTIEYLPSSNKVNLISVPLINR